MNYNRFIRKSVISTLNNITTCGYCGGFAKTIDHIIPVSKGGTNDLQNLTMACSKCNSLKNDFTVDAFFSRIMKKRYEGIIRYHYYSRKLNRINGDNDKLRTNISSKISKILSEDNYFNNIIISISSENYRFF
jgi:hypothetical protein